MNTLILGNLISLIGCLLMVATGFVRRNERVLALQCVQFGFLCAGNLVLGAVAGAISGIVGIIRNLVFFKVKSTPFLKVFFIAVQVLLSLSALSGGMIEWLPLLSAVLFTWCIDTRSEVKLKTVIILAQALWLIYDFCYHNYVAMTFDALTVLSNLIGIVMVRRSRK